MGKIIGSITISTMLFLLLGYALGARYPGVARSIGVA